MKKWKWCVPVAVLVLVVAAVVALNFSVKAQETENGVIPGRVYFGNISVSGLTKDEAIEAVEDYVEQLSKKKVTLVVKEETIETTAGELGLSWSNPEIVEEALKLGKTGNLIARYKAMKDLEQNDKIYTIGFKVDKDKVTDIVQRAAETYDTEAVDGKLEREDGQFIMTAGIQGLSVKVEESVAMIETYFSTDWAEQEATFTLVTEDLIPKGTEEELGKVVDILGFFYTFYNPAAEGRSKNVENGTEKINGTLLYPGDELSVTGICGPYTKENGYEMAGAYENGQTVDSYGGGMCQVSSTLYNAVILAELEITERKAHSMTVAYVEPSADAAIAGTYKDLKFVNNTDAPVYVEGFAKDGYISFTIWGEETRDENRQVSFESEIIESEDVITEYKESTELAIGTMEKTEDGHQKLKAKLWKIVTVDGKEESKEEFNTSSYRASNEVYEVGIASDNPEAVAAMKAAIATQDKDTIMAAIEKWGPKVDIPTQTEPGNTDTEDPATNSGETDIEDPVTNSDETGTEDPTANSGAEVNE